jgi:hypothetical protein
MTTLLRYKGTGSFMTPKKLWRSYAACVVEHEVLRVCDKIGDIKRRTMIIRRLSLLS